MRERVYIAVIIGLSFLLLMLGKCNLDQKENNELQKQYLSDSLSVTTNNLGQQTAQIGLLLTNFSSFKSLAIAKEDSLTRQLQKSVTKRTISATIATQVVKIDTVFKTTDVIPSVVEGECNPTYQLSDTTDYRTINISAAKDSFHVAVQEFEKLTFSQEWSKWNLFKKQTCISKFTNSNPDVQITGLRTYTVKCDCGKKSWFAFAGGNVTGFVLGMGAGYLTAKLK